MNRIIISILLLVPVISAGFCPYQNTARLDFEKPLRLPSTTAEFQIDRQWAQAKIDAFRALQPIEIPNSFWQNPLTPERFDVNLYFSVLTHLSMQPGWVLDYYYSGNQQSSGAYPVIYAREINQKPSTEHQSAFDAPENKIVIDGTPEGYFEYLIFYMMGRQFYLWWHANIYDWTIVCSDEAKMALFEQQRRSFQTQAYFKMDDFSEPNPTGGLALKSKNINSTPVVTFAQNKVNITVIYFTQWGGLIRSSYSIEEGNPSSIQKTESRVILKYQCGIMF